MKRLLIYSQGPSLGQLRRARNIALEVLANEPKCNVLILADTPATPMFPPVSGIDHVKLPTIIRTEDNTWVGNTLNLDIKHLISLRSQIIWQVYKHFDPDTVLVCDRPAGVLGELKPMLNQARQQLYPPKLVLGIRGALDLPEVTGRQGTELGDLDYLQTYDAILIYDSYGLRDPASDRYLLPFADKMFHCNNVATHDETPVVEPAPRDPFILVMGGTGPTVSHLVETFVQALPHISRSLSYNAVILTASTMPRANRQTILDRSDGFPVNVLSGMDDATPLIQQSEAIVTFAGYNSLCEIIQQRKKALVLPRRLDGVQSLRAKLLAERRLVMTIPPGELTPDLLAQELVNLVQSQGIPEPLNLPPLDGAQRTAAVLLGESLPAEQAVA